MKLQLVNISFGQYCLKFLFCSIILLIKQGGCGMKKLLILVITAFIFSLFIVIAPEKGNAQPLCCQITADSCFDTENPFPIECPEEDIFSGSLCNFDTGQCTALPTNIPTLSEWGLIAMVGILGVAGFFVLRRRNQATL